MAVLLVAQLCCKAVVHSARQAANAETPTLIMQLAPLDSTDPYKASGCLFEMFLFLSLQHPEGS